MNANSKKRISLIGGGWRTEGWLSVIGFLGDKYSVGKVYCRNKDKAERIRSLFGVEVEADYKEIFNDKPDIALVCVSMRDNFAVSGELVKNGTDVLCETPLFIGKDYAKILAETDGYGKLLVAEHYRYHPYVAAVKKIIDGGFVGKAGTAEVSYCHGYHAVSIIRYLLSLDTVLPDKVRTVEINDPYPDMFYRYGKIPFKITEHKREISFLTYGEKTAVYDFSGQYFCPLRSRGIKICGDKGQICGDEVTSAQGGELKKMKIEKRYNGLDGDLYPLSLKGIVFNGEYVYENPYEYKRMSEEEIAMAECLSAAAEYFECGKVAYPTAESDCDAETAQLIVKNLI